MTLDPQAVHLWQIDLRVDDATIQACRAHLSPDEIARASKFRLPILSSRYIVARGAVRSILSSYLSISPEVLRFTYNPQGKPEIASELNPIHLTFNVSHSNDRAILAVTQNSQIGVDIESIDDTRDLSQIAASHFAPSEAFVVTALQGEARTQAFYTCWTAKEAYLKAIGTGLATPLDSFEFVFPTTAPTRLIRINSSPDEHLRWQTFAFTLDSFAIAIVVQGCDKHLHHRTWQL